MLRNLGGKQSRDFNDSEKPERRGNKDPTNNHIIMFARYALIGTYDTSILILSAHHSDAKQMSDVFLPSIEEHQRQALVGGHHQQMLPRQAMALDF